MKYLNIKLFIFVGLLAVYLGFFALDNKSTYYAYTHYTYLIVLTAISIWAYRIWTNLPDYEGIRNFIKFHKYGLIVSFLLASMIFIHCKPALRVLADETNLLGMARGMFTYNLSIKNLCSDIVCNDNKILIADKIDKRPILFSMLLSIVFRVFGEKLIYAFLFNCFIGFLCLFFMYYIVSFFYNRFFGCISAIILATYPIFAMTTSSIDFDIFNVAFSLLTFILFIHFIKNKTANIAELLIFTTLMFAQTRYEESVFIPIILVYVFLYLSKSESDKLSPLFSVFPLLCLPIAWLNNLTNNPEYYEFGKDAKIFSFTHFIPNITNSCKYFFSTNSEYCNVWFYSLIFISSLIIFAIRYKKLNMENNNRTCMYYIIIFYLYHILIRFCFIGGNLSKLWVYYRLGIIFIPIIVFSVINYLFSIRSMINHYKSWYIVCSVFALVFYWSVSGTYYPNKSDYFYNFLKLSSSLLEKYYPDKNNYLVISIYPNYYNQLGYDSIHINAFHKFYDDFIKDIKENKNWKYALVLDIEFNLDDKTRFEYKKIEKNKLPTVKEIARKFFDGNVEISAFRP